MSVNTNTMSVIVKDWVSAIGLSDYLPPSPGSESVIIESVGQSYQREFYFYLQFPIKINHHVNSPEELFNQLHVIGDKILKSQVVGDTIKNLENQISKKSLEFEKLQQENEKLRKFKTTFMMNYYMTHGGALPDDI